MSKWMHGTNSSPFTSWKFPPPPKDQLTPESPAIFFTQDLAYARQAGKNICGTSLVPESKVINALAGGSDSDNLRLALRNDPIMNKCQWLHSKALWDDAWKTGDVLRFVFDQRNPSDYDTVFSHFYKIVFVKVLSLGIDTKHISDNLVFAYITRSWIDAICEQVKENGFDAIIGNEVDRWNGASRHTPSAPIARSWLAVVNGNAITAPDWNVPQ